jgi:hypothetical protein
MNATIAAQPTGVYSLISSHSVSDQGNWLLEILSSIRWKLAETLSLGGPFREAIDELGEVYLEGLEPGWDGYGAQPVSEEVLENAVTFLCRLPQDLPMPDVSADAQGEIHFEWFSNPHRTLSVSISPAGVLSYAGLFGPNRTRGLELLAGGIPPSIVSNIRRVFE